MIGIYMYSNSYSNTARCIYIAQYVTTIIPCNQPHIVKLMCLMSYCGHFTTYVSHLAILKLNAVSYSPLCVAAIPPCAWQLFPLVHGFCAWVLLIASYRCNS